MNSGAEQGFNRLLASRLRPGSSLDEVKAAWGSRWAPPGHQDHGYVGGPLSKLGAHVRLDVQGNVAEVGFAPNFPPKYAVEGLQIGMTPDAMLAARPLLRAPDPPDTELTKLGRTDFFETLADGCELRVAVQRGKVAAIVIGRKDAEYPGAQPSTRTSRKYPEPGAHALPFADANLKLGVLAALVRQGAVELGEPVELASHVRGKPVEADDIDYEFLEDVYEYLARYPLTAAQLQGVEDLSLDRGPDVVEEFVWPNFDGESDEFDVRSLEGLGHCPNVRDFAISTQVPVSLAPLRELKHLETVWICESAVVHDARVLLDLPALRSLRISGVCDLTKAEIATLKLRTVEVLER